MGRVVEISDDIVKVEIERSESCGHCSAKIICRPGTGGSTSGSKMYTEAINRAGAKIGDKVKIEVSEGISVLAGFLMFIVPLIAFLIVFAIVRVLTKSENFAVLGGFGGLIFCFLFLIGINRKVAKSTKFHPVVKEIVE